MSNANDVLLTFKEETTYATLPTGNWQTTRLMGDTLKLETATQPSDELGSRRVKDVARLDRKVTGAIRKRWSYKDSDEWFRGMLCAPEAATWSTVITSVVDATNTLTFTAPNLIKWSGASPQSWLTLGYAVGDWVRVKGAVTNGTEFRARIIVIANGTATNDLATIDHKTIITEAAITSGEVEKGGFIKDGTTEHSYSAERNYVVPASNFRNYTGLEVAQGAISINAKGLAEITFTMLGKTSAFSTSTVAGTPVAALTDRLINGVDHVRAVLNDGTAFSMSDWNMSVNNNLRERNVFGTLGPESLGRGQFNSTIGLDGYYSTNTILAKYDAFTDTSMAMEVRDAAGNSYIIFNPNGNFTDGSASPEGNNTDVRMPIQFSSKEYVGLGGTFQMQIIRWDV